VQVQVAPGEIGGEAQRLGPGAAPAVRLLADADGQLRRAVDRIDVDEGSAFSNTKSPQRA